MILANGSVYPKTGKLNFLASNIDTTLGTQQLRAEFDNKDNQLLPGQFVRIRLLTGERDGVFLVPQAAIIQTEQGPIVMLAGAEDKVAPRPIQVGEWRGKDWVVTRRVESRRQGDCRQPDETASGCTRLHRTRRPFPAQSLRPSRQRRGKR
jgi:multidrug efflux pump subunit AcrA (membrane-fusion protein)